MLWNGCHSPIELIAPTFWIEHFGEASNDELFALKIDLLEERQNHAQVLAVALQ